MARPRKSATTLEQSTENEIVIRIPIPEVDHFPATTPSAHGRHYNMHVTERAAKAVPPILEALIDKRAELSGGRRVLTKPAVLIWILERAADEWEAKCNAAKNQ